MTTVAVSERVLRWAIGRTADPIELQQKFPKLPEWLSGESQPTLRQLENFAVATSVPLGYLFLSEPPEERLPIHLFRTLDGKHVTRPSPGLLETVRMMERRQAWMRDYLVERGQEPLSFVGSASAASDSGDIARAMRKTLGIDAGWAKKQSTWEIALRALQRKMEDVGILVVVNSIVGNNTRRKLDVKEFRGFVLVDEYAPLVFVNGADAKGAQMFTLAHELAHIWFGKSAAFDLRELQPATDELEQKCDRAAAEFLVPAEELWSVWDQVKHEARPYQMIARHFKVSELVAARRAFDLALISREDFLEFYRGYVSRERDSQDQDHAGGNFYLTQHLRISRRFAEAVVRSVKEGRTLYDEAYRLTGLYGTSFERYAQRLDTGE